MWDSGCRGTVDAGLRVCSFILLDESGKLWKFLLEIRISDKSAL